MPNHRRQDRELDALYARLPEIKCQGYCHDSCGPIDMSIRERARIVERARKSITCGAYASCSMLTEDRRCSVYDIRPLICRLWGVVKSMRCPYGCVPEGGWLSDEDGVRMIVEADRIGGQPKGDRVQRIMEQMLKQLSEEELQRRASALFRNACATVAGRDGALAPTALETTVELEFNDGMEEKPRKYRPNQTGTRPRGR